jgi:hypothetical protein
LTLFPYTTLFRSNAQTEDQKSQLKTKLKTEFGINQIEKVFVTTGKNDFYKFKEVYPSLSKGVAAFEKFGVDPWYAQAILLIESPGQLKKSVSGAYGAFQLMPDVARAQGLTVNATVDERKDFERCAYGSARLLSKVCIPEARKILNKHNLTYNESDLWFRLFVLHVYHAGAGNVAKALNVMQPQVGNIAMIKQLWNTNAGGFQNCSQNYSQVAIASLFELEDHLTKMSANQIVEN